VPPPPPTPKSLCALPITYFPFRHAELNTSGLRKCFLSHQAPSWCVFADIPFFASEAIFNAELMAPHLLLPNNTSYPVLSRSSLFWGPLCYCFPRVIFDACPIVRCTLVLLPFFLLRRRTLPHPQFSFFFPKKPLKLPLNDRLKTILFVCFFCGLGVLSLVLSRVFQHLALFCPSSPVLAFHFL